MQHQGEEAKEELRENFLEIAWKKQGRRGKDPMKKWFVYILCDMPDEALLAGIFSAMISYFVWFGK